MRLAPLLALACLLAAPAASGVPYPDDGYRTVTPAKPLAVGMFVRQDGNVVLHVDVAQGAFTDLEVQAGKACRGARDMGAGTTVGPAVTGMQSSSGLTLHCGRMAAGWHVVRVSIGAGAARVALSASGATIAT